MKKKSLVRTLGAAAATISLTSGLGPYASAATSTANFGVAATVGKNCTISTNALAFGTYDPVVAQASANLDGTGKSKE